MRCAKGDRPGGGGRRRAVTDVIFSRTETPKYANKMVSTRKTKGVPLARVLDQFLGGGILNTLNTCHKTT